MNLNQIINVKKIQNYVEKYSKFFFQELLENLEKFKIPIKKATSESLKGYGFLIDSPEDVKIEITRWPPQGLRIVDSDSGDEGGITEGVFECEWKRRHFVWEE